MSEFETFLGKLDRENLARATKPQGNQDCQLKPQLPPESQNQGQLAEEERSIAWRVPLLHFVVEARTVLNVTTTDDRVRRTVLETFDKIHCNCIGKMQVQEGLVRLSKEHLRPEGGLPLSGLAFFSAENFIQ